MKQMCVWVMWLEAVLQSLKEEREREREHGIQPPSRPFRMLIG